MDYKHILIDVDSFLPICKDKRADLEALSGTFKSLSKPIDLNPFKKYLLMSSELRKQFSEGEFVHVLKTDPESEVLGKILSVFGEKVIFNNNFEDLSYSFLMKSAEENAKTLVVTPLISAILLQNMLSDEFTHFTKEVKVNDDLSVNIPNIFKTHSEVEKVLGCTPDFLPDFIALSGSPAKNLPEILPRNQARNYIKKFGGIDTISENKTNLIGSEAEMLTEANITRAYQNIEVVLTKRIDYKIESKNEEQKVLEWLLKKLKIEKSLIDSLKEASNNLENSLDELLEADLGQNRMLSR